MPLYLSNRAEVCRQVAELDDLIELCGRYEKGGMFSGNNEHLLRVFQQIRPDYNELQKQLEQVRQEALARLDKLLAEVRP
jgi:hypothetical protein